jgi:hypothetical protein
MLNLIKKLPWLFQPKLRHECLDLSKESSCILLARIFEHNCINQLICQRIVNDWEGFRVELESTWKSKVFAAAAEFEKDIYYYPTDSDLSLYMMENAFDTFIMACMVKLEYFQDQNETEIHKIWYSVFSGNFEKVISKYSRSETFNLRSVIQREIVKAAFAKMENIVEFVKKVGLQGVVACIEHWKCFTSSTKKTENNILTIMFDRSSNDWLNGVSPSRELFYINLAKKELRSLPLVHFEDSKRLELNWNPLLTVSSREDDFCVNESQIGKVRILDIIDITDSSEYYYGLYCETVNSKTEVTVKFQKLVKGSRSLPPMAGMESLRHWLPEIKGVAILEDSGVFDDALKVFPKKSTFTGVPLAQPGLMFEYFSKPVQEASKVCVIAQAFLAGRDFSMAGFSFSPLISSSNFRFSDRESIIINSEGQYEIQSVTEPSSLLKEESTVCPLMKLVDIELVASHGKASMATQISQMLSILDENSRQQTDINSDEKKILEFVYRSLNEWSWQSNSKRST